MRTATVIVALLLSATVVLADEKTDTPRESFEAFVKAVLDTDLDADARKAQFERYFDFDTWLKGHAAEEGKVYTEKETADLKQQWFELFQSDEFRATYRSRNVRVLEEPDPDRARGHAELVIAMQGKDGKDEKFRVLMTLSKDGTHWRWYSIPRIEETAAPLTSREKVKKIEAALKTIADKRAELDAQEKALRGELAKLRSDLAEKDAGASPFASPKSVVESAWKAIEKGDADALLDCHTTRRVSESKLSDVEAKIKRLRERLMNWKVLDSTIDEHDASRASVRVKLSLQRTGESDERTITIRVVRSGDDWKIDEAP